MVSFNIILKYVFQGKCNLLKTPLQRIVTGCFLVAVAFIVSGILELQLKTTFPDIPSVSQVRTISIPELQLKTTFPDIPSVSQVNPPIYHNTLGLINPNNKKKWRQKFNRIKFGFVLSKNLQIELGSGRL